MDDLGEMVASEAVICPYCQAENAANRLTCKKCGGELVSRPFWSSLQLIRCTNEDCTNKVHIRASKCPICQTKQHRGILENVQVFSLGFLSSVFAAKSGEMSAWQQFTMYTGIILGVFFSSKLRINNQVSEHLSEGFLTASLAALLIMPNVFERINFKPNTPFIVRFGFYFQSGVFADSLIAAIKIGI